MSGVTWQSSPADMALRVETYSKNLIRAVYALAEEWATRILEDAKANHGWTNRTGAAEAGLFSRVLRLAMGAIIVIGHGVHYGIHLERRFGGMYAGVTPALQRNYAAVMASSQQLVQ